LIHCRTEKKIWKFELLLCDSGGLKRVGSVEIKNAAGSVIAYDNKLAKIRLT
jgi:hypothetical protein